MSGTAVVDRLLRSIETGTFVDGDLFAATGVLDATVPHWRSSSRAARTCTGSSRRGSRLPAP